jgi:hypothetical protein
VIGLREGFQVATRLGVWGCTRLKDGRKGLRVYTRAGEGWVIRAGRGFQGPAGSTYEPRVLECTAVQAREG